MEWVRYNTMTSHGGKYIEFKYNRSGQERVYISAAHSVQRTSKEIANILFHSHRPKPTQKSWSKRGLTPSSPRTFATISMMPFCQHSRVSHRNLKRMRGREESNVIIDMSFACSISSLLFLRDVLALNIVSH